MKTETNGLWTSKMVAPVDWGTKSGGHSQDENVVKPQCSAFSRDLRDHHQVGAQMSGIAPDGP
jgi:hypothetical protein